MSDFKTADLCDNHSEILLVVDLPLRDLGGKARFCGVIETVKAFEDNSLVRECVAAPGAGKVLVIDSAGSTRRAMLGDLLAEKAVKNGWEGVIVHGCIRDSAAIASMALGVKALGTCPMKTEKRGLGDHNVPVRIGGVDFVPGHYVYADEDGVVVSPKPLL